MHLALWIPAWLIIHMPSHFWTLQSWASRSAFLCLRAFQRSLDYRHPKFMSATKTKGCIFRYIVSICVKRPTKVYMLFIILCHEINLRNWCPFLSINILSHWAIWMNPVICSLICFLQPSRMSEIFCCLKIIFQNHQLFLNDQYYNSLVHCDLFYEWS